MSQRNSLVLFDIDGTLLRGAGPQHKQALVDGILKVTGKQTSLESIPTAGMLDRDLITAMLRASGERDRRIRSVLCETMRACEECYLTNGPSDLRPFLCRGVKDVLSMLASKGAVLGLVTGNLSAIGWRKVESAGIREFFSLGAFAADGKTRARLAQVACWRAKRTGLVKRDARISLVGDHANDVGAAKSNGFQSIAVATGVMTFEELAETRPDVLVNHLEELDLEELF